MGLDALKNRFWSKVTKSDKCWIWAGYTNRDGYGRFRKFDTLVSAHRMSWELTNGEIPATKHVLHRCDNPACVNPSHLFLGTHSDNMQDMYEKKRHGNGKSNNCHPDLPYHAKGMCRACYLVQWRQRNPNRQKQYDTKRRS